MQTTPQITLTPAMLIFRISERFYSAAEHERARYTKKMEDARQEQMDHCRKQFRALVQAREAGQTQDTALTITGVQRALRTVKLAQKTGML